MTTATHTRVSGDLRAYLSHDWQDAGAVAHQVYEALGVKIRPVRLVRMLQNNYPDVLVEGEMVRLVATEGNP